MLENLMKDYKWNDSKLNNILNNGLMKKLNILYRTRTFTQNKTLIEEKLDNNNVNNIFNKSIAIFVATGIKI